MKSGSNNKVGLDDPPLTFQYNSTIIEAKIIDLGGESNNNDSDNTDNTDNGNHGRDSREIDDGIDDNRDFPLPECSHATECNWVTEGAVSPVKNQGGCGSCWAFAAAAMTEADYYIQFGRFSETERHIDLSEQQDVDCIFGHGGCQGGNSYDSWGLHNTRSSSSKVWALEEDNPYSASFNTEGQCDFGRGVKVDQHTYYEGAWEDT